MLAVGPGNDHCATILRGREPERLPWRQGKDQDLELESVRLWMSPPTIESNDVKKARPGGRSQATILVVDDEPDMLEILRLFLAAQGWTVITAPSATLALRLVKRRPPALIVTDCDMPGMTGLELCTRLRSDARTRRIPIILHTGKDAVKLCGNPPLFDRILIKPARLNELGMHIRALLRAASHRRPTS